MKNRLELLNKLRNEMKRNNTIQNELEKIKEEQRIIQEKYINMLEEKSSKFDLFIEYKEKCKKLTEEKKELKKEISSLKERK